MDFSFNVRVSFRLLSDGQPRLAAGGTIATQVYDQRTNTTVVTIDHTRIPKGYTVHQILAHEIAHAYESARLRHEQTVARYNMAMDAIINDLVRPSTVGNHDPFVKPRTWQEIHDGMRAEPAPDDWYEADWGILDATGYMTPDERTQAKKAVAWMLTDGKKITLCTDYSDHVWRRDYFRRTGKRR